MSSDLTRTRTNDWADDDKPSGDFKDKSSGDLLENSPSNLPSQEAPNTKSRYQLTRKKLIIFSSILASLLLICVVLVAVLLTRKHTKAPASNGRPRTTEVAGASGSLVTPDQSEAFTYENNFGGDWKFNPKDPFAPGGKAQSWSKRIGGEEWVWGKDIARGVNLAGWLVTQPFITPALYEKYIDNKTIAVIDEWSLSRVMGDRLAAEMEEHYATFITEQDFADIAAAGLNWVRIPIGYWAIETWEGEPYLPTTSWRYFLKAIEWGRKYGIRIFLEFNALPGSQNGWDHSGRHSTINVMNGVMGIANAQRSLGYLRTFAEFISQPQYKEVVPVLGVANDISWDVIGKEGIQSFYYAAYEIIRGVTGLGAGKGPYIAIQEGFQGVRMWEGFLEGADRLALDQHPLFAYLNDSTTSVEGFAKKSCDWALATNRSSSNFGVTLGGQFSAALNDCGYWVNGINAKSNHPDCSKWDDETTWDDAFIKSLKQVTLNTMDSLQNFFYFTWKIGGSTTLGKTPSPLWNYQLGLKKGWIPTDPREAIGRCTAVTGNSSAFDGNYPATATGGAGAGTIVPSQTVLHAFPPTTMAPNYTAAQISLLPTYTATGAVTTLPVPTFTEAPQVSVGSGWFNKDDKAMAYVEIPRCEYPDPWNAVDLKVPVAPCDGH